MTERAAVLSFPRWLIAIDLMAALFVVAGLYGRGSSSPAAAPGLSAGGDVVLFAAGAAALPDAPSFSRATH